MLLALLGRIALDRAGHAAGTAAATAEFAAWHLDHLDAVLAQHSVGGDVAAEHPGPDDRPDDQAGRRRQAQRAGLLLVLHRHQFWSGLPPATRRMGAGCAGHGGSPSRGRPARPSRGAPRIGYWPPRSRSGRSLYIRRRHWAAPRALPRPAPPGSPYWPALAPPGALGRSVRFAGAEAAEHAGVLEADGASGGLDGGAVADQVLGPLQP